MIILGLGSNIGDRLAYLAAAVRELALLLSDLRLSPIYESKALLPENAPPGWNIPFLNMAIGGLSDAKPAALLAEIKRIEKKMGRASKGDWGPREIDIDILAMGDAVVDTELFAVPHRQLLDRDFALLPLADIAPDWRYPAAGPYHGQRAADIAREKLYTPGEYLRRTELTVENHG
jgi:2-amino-4-hydroxy-6-hydroxymethyldihydropteridine diphosphokinase